MQAVKEICYEVKTQTHTAQCLEGTSCIAEAVTGKGAEVLWCPVCGVKWLPKNCLLNPVQ